MSQSRMMWQWILISTTCFSITIKVFGQVATPNTIEDRFGRDEAASIASPHKMLPGFGTFSLVQTDGSYAISGNKLVGTAQSTPTENDLYWRRLSSVTTALGLAYIVEYTPTTLGAGVGSTPGSFIGFSNNTTLQTSTMDNSVALQNSIFGIWSNLGGTRVMQHLPAVPATADTFGIAVVLGGMSNSGDYITRTPYYDGQTKTDYLAGSTVFIKKNTGNWFLQGKSSAVQSGSVFPSEWQYNGAGNTTFILVPKQTVETYLQPLHYLTSGSEGNQIFDVNPVVGSAHYDSLTQNITQQGGYFGNSAASAVARTTIELGVSDVYVEAEYNFDTIEGVGFEFRYNAADASSGKRILVLFNVVAGGSNDLIRIFDENTVLLATAAASFDFAATGTIRASVIGNTYFGSYVSASGVTASVSATDDFNPTGTIHGLRFQIVASGSARNIRWYRAGGSGEYNGFNDIIALSSAQRRGNQ